MTTYLLDANVLIALTVSEHEHHSRASAWMSTIERFALCPVVEGALVRFLVRIGESAQTAADVLRRVHAMPRCAFWPDALSYREVQLDHVLGHRQVTDAYLLTLVSSRARAKLATFDAALAGAMPGRTIAIP